MIHPDASVWQLHNEIESMHAGVEALLAESSYSPKPTVLPHAAEETDTGSYAAPAQVQ